MKDSAWHVFFLGLITLLGGIDGYISAGSMASLIGGGILGCLLLVATVFLLEEKMSGWFLAFFATLAILLKFAPEFQVDGDLYPAGLMAAISVWVLGALIVNKIWEWNHEDHVAAH